MYIQNIWLGYIINITCTNISEITKSGNVQGEIIYFSLSQRNSCKIVQMLGSPIGLKLWEINLTCINESHTKFQVPHLAGIKGDMTQKILCLNSLSL